MLAISAYNKTKNVRISWIYNDRSDGSLLHTAGLLFRELPVAVRLDQYAGIEDLYKDIRDQARGGLSTAAIPTRKRVSPRSAAPVPAFCISRICTARSGSGIT